MSVYYARRLIEACDRGHADAWRLAVRSRDVIRRALCMEAAQAFREIATERRAALKALPAESEAA